MTGHDSQRLGWDSYYSRGQGSKADPWLEAHRPLFGAPRLARTVDLGCGSGTNLAFLLGVSDEVHACDYSPAAIDRVRTAYPEVSAKVVDFREGLPYPEAFFDLEVADLSFHYFEAEVTYALLAEAARILKPRGLLLCRVNASGDLAHGAGRGREVEPHLYLFEGSLKRFFDSADVDRFFSPAFEVLAKAEARSGKYQEEKVLWDLACRRS